MLCNITCMYYINNCVRIILYPCNHGKFFDLLRMYHEGNVEYYVVVTRLCSPLCVDTLNIFDTIHETDAMLDIVSCLGCILQYIYTVRHAR
jgi:hypothetical protein